VIEMQTTIGDATIGFANAVVHRRSTWQRGAADRRNASAD
jgi:hypothetical protein